MAQKVRATQPAHSMLAAVLAPDFTHNQHGLPYRFETACDVIVNPVTKVGLDIPAGHVDLADNLIDLFEKLKRRKGSVTCKLNKKFIRALRHIRTQKKLHSISPDDSHEKSEPRAPAMRLDPVSSLAPTEDDVRTQSGSSQRTSSDGTRFA